MPLIHPPQIHPPANSSNAADGNGKPVILAEPDVEVVAAKVGRVALQDFDLRVQRLAKQNPAGVRPPAALARRVRVAFLIAELVMDAMRRHPEYGATFKRHRGEDAHHVFDPLGSLVAAMRQQPVIAHADAHIDGQHIKDRHDRKPLPAEEEESGQRARVEDGDDRQG